MNRATLAAILCFLAAIVFSFAQEETALFRSSPLQYLSSETVKSMLAANDFFDAYANKKGRGFPNKFQSRKNDRVVADMASGLLWQQSGSAASMNFEETGAFIDNLNAKNFAGCNTWRIPTLEEAMSLLEKEKQNGELHIDPLFDPGQQWIWTTDKDSSRAWLVYFFNGYCVSNNVKHYGYVRAVSFLPPESSMKKKHTEVAIFRSNPQENLSEASVKAILGLHNLYCAENNFTGVWSNAGGSGFGNNYEAQRNGSVIFDHASGLMWQQSGSLDYVQKEGALTYIDSLNNAAFSGYTDWRLPTLEEAMSLIEREKNNGELYIDPLFDQKQVRVWTTDQKDASAAWVVSFYYGICRHYDIHFTHYVRAVR